jgi:FtsZ-interacting cell division protein ZipA
MHGYQGGVFLDNTYIIIVAALVVVVLGVLLGLVFSRRKRSEKFHDKYGAEYDNAVTTKGSEKEAQAELNERRKHVKSLDIRPLTANERERYQTEWTAVQAKFVDEPGQAIIDADRLIIEVMQIRDYPVSDFDQRAADISIKYPTLVSNYRAAREIALKNKQHEADTEELRQAMIYYHSLFSELLETEAVVVEKK